MPCKSFMLAAVLSFSCVQMRFSLGRLPCQQQRRALRASHRPACCYVRRLRRPLRPALHVDRRRSVVVLRVHHSSLPPPCCPPTPSTQIVTRNDRLQALPGPPSGCWRLPLPPCPSPPASPPPSPLLLLLPALLPAVAGPAAAAARRLAAAAWRISRRLASWVSLTARRCSWSHSNPSRQYAARTSSTRSPGGGAAAAGG